MDRSRLLAACALVVAATLARSLLHAGSTLRVAATGDQTPLGGVFAGPGFAAWPAAAGDFFAFRAEVAGRKAREVLVLASSGGQVEVAATGEPAPGTHGVFKSFLGSPAVNEQGDVAFFAVISGRGQRTGLFRFHGGELTAVALAKGRAPTGAGGSFAELGTAGAAAPPLSEDTPELAPAIDGSGRIAFAASLSGGARPGGIFVAEGGEVRAALLLGTPVRSAGSGGVLEFTALGAPRMNASGTLAFWGKAADAGSAQPPQQGVFVLDTAGGLYAVARQGDLAATAAAFSDFARLLAVGPNDRVAFFAHTEGEATPNQEFSLFLGAPGAAPAMVASVGFMPVGSGSISGFRLAESWQGGLAPPAVDQDGSVVFFATTASSPPEGIFRADGAKTKLVVGWGNSSFVGGKIAGFESGPVAGAGGDIVFRVRLRGGKSSAAVLRIGAHPAAVAVGDRAPRGGIFAGPPFGDPQVNDSGEVVFRAYVAGGRSSEGVFLYGAGKARALAWVGAQLPGEGSPLSQFLGEPTLNRHGEVAFTAGAEGGATGVYVASAAGTRAVVHTGQSAPVPPGGTFHAITGKPAINDDGEVAFRATVRLDRGAGQRPKQAGIFFAQRDGSISAIAMSDEQNPIGPVLASLGNPVLSNRPSVAFRASVRSDAGLIDSLFAVVVHPGATALQAIAAEGTAAGGGWVFAGLSGPPALAPDGELAFLAARRATAGAGGGATTGAIYLSVLPGARPEVLAAAGDQSAGGRVFTSLGVPAISARRDVAFRAAVADGPAEESGVFIAPTGAAPAPVALVGEPAAGGGWFRSFAPRVSIASPHTVAFRATIADPSARNAVFLASPARLRVRLRLPLRGRGKMRLRFNLTPGPTSDGVHPRTELFRGAVRDGAGEEIASFSLPPGTLRRRGRHAYGYYPRRRPAAGELRSLHISRMAGKRRRRKSWSLRAVFALPDRLKGAPARPLEPLVATLALGTDTATAQMHCRGRRVLRCRGRIRP